MKANQVQGAIIITHVATIEGEVILETECRDYDHYTTLPNVVDYMGMHLGKTGWSSDTHKACYKHNVHIAYAVK